MKTPSSKKLVWLFAVLLICFSITTVLARGGGGGGHSSGGHGGGGGGSHSSSSGGGYSGGYYGGGSGGGGSIDGSTIIFVIIIVVVILILVSKFGKRFAPAKQIQEEAIPFPEGLDATKVQSAFMGVQKAWQEKNLKDIRKWISDGVYQRYTAQFAMMNKLDQVNILSNIRINSIKPTKTSVDGKYHTVDVGVSFTIDDKFVSNKYPQFNESYPSDSDVEYWTFIKRGDAKQDTNMYNNSNCPNCSSPFTTEMGEISRCVNCGTLTNTANYDWVLSEITQDEDYTTASGLERDANLHQLTQNDHYFSVQRLEDIASNVFMQIMQVMGGEKEQRLSRFADKDSIAQILSIRGDLGNFIFNRLYLNEVTMDDYNTDNGHLNLSFMVRANFQRVQAGQTIRLIDDEIMTRDFHLVLSKNLSALNTAAKETVYSYECPTCAAPYTDTTNDVCPYCGTGLADMDKSWVLTDFRNG